MAVLLAYSGGIGHFTRAYVRGFYTDSDFPIVSISDHTLQLTQVGYDVQIYMVIKPHFYAPSSNHYTSDYVFDGAASQAYYLGVPYLAGFDITLINDPVDFSWRIKLGVPGHFGTPSRIDLPALSDYWRPL